MILNIIIGVVLVLFALIGLAVGLVKGYTKVETWAGEYVVSALLTICIGAILNKFEVNPIVAGAITIVCAVVFLLACIGISNLIRILIEHTLAKRDDDMTPYGKLGIFNRILGGLTLAVKGMTIALIIILPILFVIDIAQISAIESFMETFYNGFVWRIFKPILFDLFVIGMINLAIRHGFARGIISALWTLLVFVFIAGAAYFAYNLVFNTNTFTSVAEAFSGDIAGWFGETPIPEGLPLTLAKIAITGGLFALMLAAILLVAFFVPRIIAFARLGNTVYIADGIMGAIVMIIIIVAIMLAIGYVIQPLYGFDFMKPFDGYFNLSTMAKYFYNENIIVNVGVPVLPIRDYIA